MSCGSKRIPCSSGSSDQEDSALLDVRGIMERCVLAQRKSTTSYRQSPKLLLCTRVADRLQSAVRSLLSTADQVDQGDTPFLARRFNALPARMKPH